MKCNEFQAQYPTISGLLPSSFMSDTDSENTLRRAIEHDRTDYLDILDNLAQKTPAKEIRKDPNRLTSKTNFQSFYAEMKAYVALKHWVFAPYPADVQGTQGKPDYEFNIGELDIEVASRTAWDKKDNVVVTLKDKLENTPYTAQITLLDDFIKVPYTGQEIDHNEQLVDDITSKIDAVDVSNPPSSVSNNGIEVEFEKTNGSGSVIMWDQAEEILLDPQGRVVDQIEDKVKKQRGSRPLLIFYDVDVSFFDVEDLERLVHGDRNSGPGIEVSDEVYQHEPRWGEYLREQGYIPESGKKTYIKMEEPDDPNVDLRTEGDSCIRDGDEGLFADSTFDRVAGIVFLDEADRGYFLPNFYSQKMSFHRLYQDISRNMELQSNNFKDLL